MLQFLAAWVWAALSCRAERQGMLETLFGPLFRGPARLRSNSDASQFAGLTTLGSGQATVTVSTRAVGSDSIVGLALRTATALNSGFGADLCVRTINPGNCMILGWSDGVARALDVVAMWEIKRGS